MDRDQKINKHVALPYRDYGNKGSYRISARIIAE